MMSDKVTFVIINFNTRHLTEMCVSSLLDCYPRAKLLIVDNGSNETDFLTRWSVQKDNVIVCFNNSNITHGPAMHQAIHLCQTDYVFFLDSDCIVRKSGLIEEMLEYNAYAVGNIQLVDKNGINVPDTYRNYIQYIHPSVMLINRKQYFLLPPFIAHDAPCIKNMIVANTLGFVLVDFSIGDYVIHLGRGTRDGLGINWTGQTKHKANILKRLWRAMRNG